MTPYHNLKQMCHNGMIEVLMSVETMSAGFMAGSCVKACNLCYPALPAAELDRMHLQHHSQNVEHESAISGETGSSPQLSGSVVDGGVL